MLCVRFGALDMKRLPCRAAFSRPQYGKKLELFLSQTCKHPSRGCLLSLPFALLKVRRVCACLWLLQSRANASSISLLASCQLASFGGLCLCTNYGVFLHCGIYEWKALYFINFLACSPCFGTSWLSCGMQGTAEFKLMCQVGGTLVTK